jgi:SAM-dependent methyltransferase
MSDSERTRAAHAIDEFTGPPTRDLSAWRWLWEGDHAFPIQSHRGPLGRLVVWFKRLVRPWVKVPQNDLWERQRVFNLVLLGHLEDSPELDRLRWNAQELKDLSIFLTRLHRTGIEEIVEHNDALYSAVDQKLDRYRRESKRLWAELGSALAVAEGAGGPRQALDDAVSETVALELEAAEGARTPGRAERLAACLDSGLLPPSGRVLELECGRGEGLELLVARGYDASGVESRAAAVEACRGRGLSVERGGAIEALSRLAPGTLDGIVGLAVVERHAPDELARLARLAWRALGPGGVLLLESASPLSLVGAARDFWLDPDRLRPVHPEGLAALLRAAGFEPVRRLDRHPFAEADRLPEIPLDGLEGAPRELADRVNRLRDRLDELLFGYLDYVLVGVKPTSPPG